MSTTAALSLSAPDNPLIFLHVPKTAGTTLWLILRRQYSPRAVLRIDHASHLSALSEQQKAETQVLLGHLAYGAHHFQSQPTYVTVLREPLERALSEYCHWSRCTDTPLTLRDYLHSTCFWTDNLQTRMLAGPEAETLPFGACDRDVFEQAKRNLTENIEVAGLTERFDEMLLLLQRRFGWRMPCYVPENVGGNRIYRDAVPRDLLRKIWETTEWDRALYALATKQFEARIAEQGPVFSAALCRFRIANIRYRHMRALVSFGPLRVLKGTLPVDKQMRLETAVRSILNATSGRGSVETRVLSPKPALPMHV